ncbi:MAG: cyclic nucleotide-binding domain-containing protein [Pseudomonadota bacterium]
MEQYLDVLRTINPLSTFGAEQFTAFLDAASTRELTQGECVYLEGDEDELIIFLADGAIARKSASGQVRSLAVGDDAARYAMGNLQPRPHTAQVTSDSAVVVEAPRGLVEDLATRSQLVTGEMPSLSVTDVADAEGLDGSWMFQIVQSEIFRELPTENIELFFAAVERMECEAGQEIVRQGDDGDYYYMIVEGQAEVRRMAGQVPIPIATLEAGQSFGEEALISGLPRNATVVMTQPGVLMRLAKERFKALLIRPVVQSLSAREAARQVKQDGAVLIDVRMENEHGSRSIRGSRNIPLYRLRDAIAELDAAGSHIAYCDCGARSSAAAFLLSQHGINASFIEGGMSAMLAGQ